MSERIENDLDWPSSDVMVSYDPVAQQIRFTTISTKRLLRRVYVSTEDRFQTGDVITSRGVVRPYVDLSAVPRWRYWLNQLTYWWRSKW